MNLRYIKKLVEIHSGVDLSSKKRDREHSDARALYYQLSREFTEHTFSAIGATVNRDHSTVVHGVKHIFMHVDRVTYLKLKMNIADVIRTTEDNINEQIKKELYEILN